MLEHFFLSGPIPLNAETGRYIPFLVIISYLMASFGAYASLTLATCIFSTSSPKEKRILHWAGALALGSGIWTMHFIGMLAYQMRMSISYDPWLTGLSMVIAVTIAYGVLRIIQPATITARHFLTGAVLLGFGICAMHYIGMKAMVMQADLRYIPSLFFTSVAIAIVASAAALWIVFYFSRNQHNERISWRAAAALAIGAAICGMHYTGMSAAVFIPYADCRFDSNQNFDTLALVIFIVTGGIMIGTLAIEAYGLRKNIVRSGNLIPGWMLPFSVLLTVSLLLGFMIYEKSERDYKVALESYRRDASADANATAKQVESVLDHIYHNIRTISFLPSVEGLNEHNRTLDDDARESIRQIYNNLRSTVEVSEIYITSADMDPDSTAPATAIPHEPLLQFDELIGGHSSKHTHELQDPLTDQEIEIYEYRLIKDQMMWFKQHRPDRDSINGLEVPLIGGPEVITCDNTSFAKTHKDQDRTGLVFSVPFYGKDGRLKGAVSAIILSSAIKNIIPDADYSLVNTGYHVAISNDGGADESSQQWVMQGKPDPRLLYSKVLPLGMPTTQTPWVLWAGLSNARFLESAQVSAIRTFEYTGYGIAVLLPFLGMLFWQMTQRNLRLNQANLVETEKRAALAKQMAEKERMENQLQQYITRMEEAQFEMMEAKEHAIKANATKSEFLANMSHELRTPLNSILGMQRLLLDSELTKEQRELTETSFEASVSLLEIVNDILDLSKIEAGEMKLEHIGFDIQYVFHSVVHTLDHTAREKRLPIMRHYDSVEFPYLLGDPTRLGRVLTNLIGNAIKYTDKGFIDVRAFCKKLDDKHIEMRCEIVDTGIGIPKDKQERIFEKFVQGDTSTTRKYGGTGLGLAITKQFIEMMGGRIGVTSEIGQGSTFWFTIPFEITDKLNEDRFIRRQKMLYGTIQPKYARVLIAEDHPMNQAFMKKIMQKFGIGHMHIAENGLEAIQAYGEQDWDVILMDCHMPELNGYHATKDIRELEKTSGKHVPIIAMTANAMVGDKEKCLRYGMDEYISKPINIDELKEVMGQWIRFPDISDAEKGRQKKEIEAGAVPVDLDRLHSFTDGDKELEKQLAGLFVQQSQKNLKTLGEQLETSGPNDDWRDAAHTLKGASANLGAVALSALCAEAQHFVGDAKPRAVLYEKIYNEYVRVENYLRTQGLLD